MKSEVFLSYPKSLDSNILLCFKENPKVSEQQCLAPQLSGMALTFPSIKGLVSASLQQGSIICVPQKYRESQVVGSTGALSWRLLVPLSPWVQLHWEEDLLLLSGRTDKACSGFWAAIGKFHPCFTGMTVYTPHF